MQQQTEVKWERKETEEKIDAVIATRDLVIGSQLLLALFQPMARLGWFSVQSSVLELHGSVVAHTQQWMHTVASLALVKTLATHNGERRLRLIAQPWAA